MLFPPGSDIPIVSKKMNVGEGHLENSIGHIPEGLLKDAMSNVLPMQGGHPMNGECLVDLRLEVSLLGAPEVVSVMGCKGDW